MRAVKNFNQRGRLRKRERQKCNSLDLFSKTTTLHVHQAFLYISYCHCTTTTWKCLISRFVEDVNTRQRLSSSLPELRYSLLEFISRKKKLPTFDELNETPSKREKVWDSVTSLFKWRFQRRRRLCCLQSSLTIKNRRRLNRWSVY